MKYASHVTKSAHLRAADERSTMIMNQVTREKPSVAIGALHVCKEGTCCLVLLCVQHGSPLVVGELEYLGQDASETGLGALLSCAEFVPRRGRVEGLARASQTFQAGVV